MAQDTFPYLDRIITDPEILGGKPIVASTRITVERVLEYLAVTPNFNEVFADYPRLSMTDIQACLAYASTRVAGEPVRAPRRSRQPSATA